jgi:hypothetical protein
MSQIASDRRESRRYELHLPIHYHFSDKSGTSRSGSATTCDLSTTGLSFRTRKPLPVGIHIELVVDWPTRYGDIYPIDLLMTGFVVRSTSGRTGVRVASRRFRVASEQPAAVYQATA